MGRIAFAARMARARALLQPKSCPYCGCDQTELLGRKKVILDLRRCRNCQLQFRYPKDLEGDSELYYQTQYRQWHSQDLGKIRECAGPAEFIGKKAASEIGARVALAREIVPTGRVLDFGCSWGYAPTLFRDAGLDVVGFEISVPRAEIARDLFDLTVHTELAVLSEEAVNPFDLIYSSHVLEHLPDIGSVLLEFRRLIKAEGAAVFFVPNGGGEKARRLGTRWGSLISEEHCLALDAQFFATALPQIGFEASFRSEPYDDVATSDPNENLLGDELMVIAKPQ